MLKSDRPDSVSAASGLWTFGSEFFRTRHYDFVDRRDMRPAVAELWDTAGIIRKQWDNRRQWRDKQQDKQSNKRSCEGPFTGCSSTSGVYTGTL